MSETRARSPRTTAAKVATSESAPTPAAEKTAKPAKPAKRTRTRTTEISRDAIEQRAYELSQDGGSGTPEENWLRAEQELRDSAGA